MKRSSSRRFESASAMALGRAQLRRASLRAQMRWLPVALLLSLVAVAAGALWLTLDSRFYIYHADVVGAKRVSRGEIFRASNLSGLHVLWVRSAEIEANILSTVTSVESAQVACRLPAECVITVAERQPRVMWEEVSTAQTEERLWWIDADGVIFPAQGTLPEGWVVRGPLPRNEDGRLDEPVRVALSELWAAGESISERFDYVPGRGLVFTDLRGWRTVLGEGPGMAERLRVLEWLTDDLEARGLASQLVDVRFPEAPYYSLTNEW